MASLLNSTDYLVYDLPIDQVTGALSTDGTFDAAFPLSNLFDTRPWVPVKFTINPTFILIDHTVATRLDLATFFQCNLDGATHVKRGNTTSATSMDVTVTVPAPFASGQPEQPYADMTADAGYNGATGYRYTRITFANTALLSLGLVRLTAQLRQSVVNVQWGLKGPKVFPVLENPSEGGCQLGYSLGVRNRQLIGQFLNVSDTNFATLDTWFESTLGRHLPFLLIPKPSENKAWWVKWGASSAWVFERGFDFLNNNSMPAAWDEVGRGLKP